MAQHQGARVQIDTRFRLQNGIITATQALGSGLTRRRIEGKLERGEWLPVRRGVYRLAAVPFDWDARVRAEVEGRRCVVSHRSATVLFGLDIFTEPKPELTLPTGARASSTATLHRTRMWDLRNETKRRGLPCTGIERTLIDCASNCPIEVVERLAEAAILRRLTSWSEIEICRIDHATSGRDGLRKMSQLLDLRRGTPTVSRSDFSLLVSNLLVGAGLPRPLREFPVANPNGGHILALDLAWPDVNKAWELDGLTWHFEREDIERDKWKRNQIKSQGWTIQEVTWSMFRDRPGELIALARDFLTHTGRH